MHFRCSKRRHQSIVDPLPRGSRSRSYLFIGQAVKAIPDTHVELTCTQDLQPELVEGSSPRDLIEGRFLWTVPDQVIAFLIFNYALNAFAEIVSVMNKKAACLLREIV